jgi:catechol 2,3-dioxygenase-like lactoylglutathione lyase family enzyme
MIEASGVDHLMLHVSDVERSKKFYTEILGMTVYREGEGQVFLRVGRPSVALFEKTGQCVLNRRSRPQPSGIQYGHGHFRDAESRVGEVWRRGQWASRPGSVHLLSRPRRASPAADGAHLI